MKKNQTREKQKAELRTYVEAVSHDALELRVDFLGGPGETLAILGHLETRYGDTTAVGGLCRCKTIQELT